MKKLRIKLGACWRWMRCLVLRSSEWESGNLGVLEARRSKKDGRVEIFAPRSNAKHSLWLETHKDHWGKFEQNTLVHPPQVGCDASSDHDSHDETTYQEIP